MNIAVAFSAYDSEQEYILDPTYGELRFTSLSWGNDENGKPFSDRQVLESHSCTREELNLEGDPTNARFFRPHPSSEWYVDFYWKKFLCIQPEEMRIYGDFNSFEAR